MNDVMEQIKTLSATLDEETTRFHPTGRLLLLGSYESVFLKAVKRKADLLGIDCDLTQYPCPPYKAVVVDRETVPSDIKLTAEVDIDHSYSQGMSSVSQATLALLLALDLVHAKDMVLDNEQAKQLADYAVKKEVYNWDGMEWIVTEALAHGNKVVINADW